MLIYSSNTHKEGHTDSAISPIFALSYLRSLHYAEVSNWLLIDKDINFNSELSIMPVCGNENILLHLILENANDNYQLELYERQ
jgi:hypothetical protein